MTQDARLEQLSQAIAQAIRRMLGDISGTTLNCYPRLIYSSAGDGRLVGQYRDVSNYKGEDVWTAVHNTWNSNELIVLADLLAEHNCKLMSTAIAPSDEQWRRSVAHDFVHIPLTKLLARRKRSALVLGSMESDWTVDEAELGASSLCLAQLALNRTRSAVAVCPLDNLQWDNRITKLVDLGDGVSLVRWSDTDRCLFMTHHGSEYPGDDPSLSFSDGYLRFQIAATTPSDFADNIANQIDRIGWALMMAHGASDSLHELGIVVRGVDGYPFRTIRREFPHFYDRQGGLLTLTAEGIATTQSLLKRLQVVETHRDDLAHPLRQLGRSVRAPTAHDSLVESVIGMENLILSGDAETSYRFQLRGTALLSSALKENPVGDLSLIYRKRSGIVHGRKPNKDSIAIEGALASKARHFLALMVLAVVEAVENGSVKGKKIPAMLEELVAKRVFDVRS